jgi:hypothetical protein
VAGDAAGAEAAADAAVVVDTRAASISTSAGAVPARTLGTGDLSTGVPAAIDASGPSPAASGEPREG